MKQRPPYLPPTVPLPVILGGQKHFQSVNGTFGANVGSFRLRPITISAVV